MYQIIKLFQYSIGSWSNKKFPYCQYQDAQIKQTMNMITLDIHDGYSKKIIQITRIECEITSNALNTLIFVALI